MARTMSDEQEQALRGGGPRAEYNYPVAEIWAELDATRAHAAELERDLAAAQAECAELREALEDVSDAIGEDQCTCRRGDIAATNCPHRVAANAISRTPGSRDALRKMLLEAVKKSWDGALDYAASGQFDGLTDVEAEGIVARLLGEPQEAKP